MKYDLKEILSISLDIAERMIKCGGEISKAEKTIEIICKNYGVKYIESTVLNSIIIATIRNENDSVTESRRITYHSNNLKQLELVNELSRQICSMNVSRKDVLDRLDSIKKEKNDFKYLFGGMLASFSFTLLFKGTLLDGVISIFISVLLFVFSKYIINKKVNILVKNFIFSFIIGFMAILLKYLGFVNNFDKVIIGDIMLLIPGLSMFVSVNDIFKGDTISGVNRCIEGLLLALSIASGVGLSLLLLKGGIYHA